MLYYILIGGDNMSSFEVDLNKAMSLCEGKAVYNNELEKLNGYHKLYTFTTENISDYMKYFDFENKSLLTVGSSFDQCLNAFYYGARDIALFDINIFSKYYAYLKIAGIISLDYKEFQMFFFKRGLTEQYNKYMFSKEIYEKIKPTLRILYYESFLLFDELFNIYSKEDIRNHLFDDDECRNDVIRAFNIYLSNEENYNKLKSIIKNITFKYINGDIFKDNIKGKYDNILLSNLCGVTNLYNFKNLVKKLDRNNLNINGSILIGYLWAIKYDETKYNKEWKDIYKMPITREKLKKYITEYHEITGSRDILWERDNKEDLVLIYRKKR